MIPLVLGALWGGAIADAYDAMRSTRVYQPATPADRIMAMMVNNDGSQFDHHLVRRFIGLMGVYPPGTVVRLTTGDIGVVRAGGGEARRPEVSSHHRREVRERIPAVRQHQLAVEHKAHDKGDGNHREEHHRAQTPAQQQVPEPRHFLVTLL